MRDRIDLNAPMPRFWAPKPSRFWKAALSPLVWAHRWHHRIAWISIHGMERLRKIPRNDGVLVCPNHSYTGDASVVMKLARQAPRTTCIMAAWHVFRGHMGLDGWLLQRQGLFSVDREGCDRRAIRTAIDLLRGGGSLIVFPEGEIYHLNDRLMPLREGVAYFAVSAQKELEKSGSTAHVWVVPVAIRYRFIGNILRRIELRLAAMERRMLIKPKSTTALHQRIIHLGEVLLTIKEKEYLGRSYETEGALPARIARFVQHLLLRREQQHLGRTNESETVPVRVKLLRRKLLEEACQLPENVEPSAELRDALADIHLALQLFSYPGDYISSRPTAERMAETLEKFEEDMDGTAARPIGWRRARLLIGEPIIVRPVLQQSTRAAVAELTVRLEDELQQLMSA